MAPPADTSNTERIRRKRAQIQAYRFATAALYTREEGTAATQDQSTWLNRRFGQMAYRRPIATGQAATSSCCTNTIVYG